MTGALAADNVAKGQANLLKLTAQQVKALGLQSVELRAATDGGRWVLPGQVIRPPDLVKVFSAPVAGLVEQVWVARGDEVGTGGRLVSLSAPQAIEWQKEYQQAQLQAELAKQIAQRDARLFDEGIIAGARAQASKQQWLIAQTALQERIQLLKLLGVRPGQPLSASLVVTAAEPGAVTEVAVQPGQRVEAGAMLLKFVRRGPLWLELQANAAVSQRLRVGDMIRVKGCEAPAKVMRINPQIDVATQTQIVRAQWSKASDCVMPDQRVEAELAFMQSAPAHTSEQPAWLVPSSAVVKHRGQDVLFVQRSQGWEMVPVRLQGQQAAPNGNGVLTQIFALQATDLKSADRVVVQGTVALKGAIDGLGAE